jgi:hypothetical protein
MEILQRVIGDNHQYAPLFRHAHEVLADAADNANDISIRLRVAPGVHVRRGNLLTADEVAVILPNEQSAEPRDIILPRQNGPLLRISDLHPAYSPLYYVLLFPHSENSWHPDLKLDEPDKDHPKRLSQTRYVAYRLQVRTDKRSAIHRGC